MYQGFRVGGSSLRNRVCGIRVYSPTARVRVSRIQDVGFGRASGVPKVSCTHVVDDLDR